MTNAIVQNARPVIWVGSSRKDLAAMPDAVKRKVTRYVMPIEIKREKVEPGSGNVFTDIGLEDAEELDTKVMLVAEINRRIAARQLSQVAAAELLMIGQPKISALRNYKLDGFSVERLMNFLVRLGCSVEIRIDARPREQLQGRISVVAR